MDAVADTARRTRRSGRALVVLGLLALLLGAWGSAQYRSALARAPLLRQPSGIAVDAAGRIYCGVAASRIHVYDDSGRIVRVWPVPGPDPAQGGGIRLRLTGAASDPRVEVAVRGRDEVRVYDAEGELVAVREVGGAFEAFGPTNDRSFVGPEGTRTSFDGTAIVREKDGERTTVVDPVPIPLRWFADTPWLLVLVFVLGPIAIFAGIVRMGRAAPAGRRTDDGR